MENLPRKAFMVSVKKFQLRCICGTFEWRNVYLFAYGRWVHMEVELYQVI